MDRIKAIILMILALTLAGCGASSAAKGDVSQRPVRVTTTVGMISDIVQNVGGERVSVTGLMGPGVDPHLYKPSASDIK
ncbi:MAG TPA: zinc ABC transporter substrate-binding protein, partial [Herpetosiphonaceae bacterium]|nr:zinc ABC transporter substrate-binding protein [Herpetosiphonaceae bacterium]